MPRLVCEIPNSFDAFKIYTHERSAGQKPKGLWGAVQVSIDSVCFCKKEHRGHLLACDRLALSPVACGSSLLGPSGLTPNLMEGGGPVFCGERGVAVGCWGIGGTGGGDE